MSLWQMAQAATFTLTSPARGGAISTSSITSGFPNSRQTAAFTSAPSKLDGLQFGEFWRSRGQK